MRRMVRGRWVVAGALVLLATTPALAWNPTGHRVTAEIAFQRLDETTRKKVADLLRKHPAHNDLWANRPTNGPDEALNLFMNASIFPDDARRPPLDRYNRPKDHYVNYRILANEGNRVEPPLPDENILDSYAANLRKVGDSAASSEERALALSWIFHQAADIHMPLHAVARFSKALPAGDRGGNSVGFPNPRATANGGSPKAKSPRSSNLHAYWDGLLGYDETPANIDRLVAQLTTEYPADGLADELRRPRITQWAEESVSLSVKTVYRGLDPNTTRFETLPAGYEAEAQKTGRRRIVLAGYRLAEQLKTLFADR